VTRGRDLLAGEQAVADSDRAVVVGEALVDIVRMPDGRSGEHPGGSAANVAVALIRLGRSTTLVTQYADDHHGSVLDEHLRAEGLDLLVQPPRRGRTSSARARLASTGAATYEFELAWDLTPVVVPDRPIVVHTGSLAAVLGPGADGVVAMVDALRSRATVSYDLNLRPAAMGPPAQVAERVRSLVARSDLVKASDEDLAELVTLGARGAICLTGAGELEVAAPAVTVADTIAAGDTFCAAIIDGLWTRDLLGGAARDRLRSTDVATWADVLGRAVVAASIAVTRPGADPPTRAELESRTTAAPVPRAFR
jgi:fructokinase